MVPAHLSMNVHQALHNLPEQPPNSVHITPQPSINAVSQRALFTVLHLLKQ